MVFDIKQVFTDENVVVPVDFSLDLSKDEIDGYYPFVSPIKVLGNIRNCSGIIKLKFTVDFSYSRPCDRCAEITTREMSFNYEHILVAELSSEDTDEYVVVADYCLDMSELARADIILSLPMKYLCSDDCKGVCPICGANKNLGSCNCTTKTVDPRLEALQQLLDN